MATLDTEPANNQSVNPLQGSIDVSALVIAATHRMQDENIHHLVVLKDDQIVGVVTDCDLIVRCVAARRQPSRTHICDIVSAVFLSGGGAVPFSVDPVYPIEEHNQPTCFASVGEKREGPPAVGSGLSE